jgi:hypothetical protein
LCYVAPEPSINAFAITYSSLMGRRGRIEKANAGVDVLATLSIAIAGCGDYGAAASG